MTTTVPAYAGILLWAIDRFVPYLRNPRQNDAAVDRMAASIQEFGFKIPVLARTDGEVVDGHLSLKAARKLGLAEVPVILCDEWSPAQVKLLGLELLELKGLDFNLDLTGFDSVELDRYLAGIDSTSGLTVDDAAPDAPEVPVSRLADLWVHRPDCRRPFHLCQLSHCRRREFHGGGHGRTSARLVSLAGRWSQLLADTTRSEIQKVARVSWRGS